MGNTYKAIKSKHYIQNLIEEGEHEHQDFKFQFSDARKIARRNNSGGRLLIGVKDNGNIAGVESDEEIYMIEQAATMYCRPSQQVAFSIYKVEGKIVLKVDIAPATSRPVQAQDDDRKWRAYYRVADENILAHPLHVKLWRRINENDDGAQFTFSKVSRGLIDYISQSGGVTVDDCMKQMHISRAAVEDMVIALCRMGAAAMDYSDGRFLITAKAAGMQ